MIEIWVSKSHFENVHYQIFSQHWFMFNDESNIPAQKNKSIGILWLVLAIIQIKQMCRRLPFLIWRLGASRGVGWPVCLGGGVDASCMKLQAFLWSALQFQLWGLGAESRSRCTKVHPIFCRIRFCDLWRISMLAQTGAALHISRLVW